MNSDDSCRGAATIWRSTRVSSLRPSGANAIGRAFRAAAIPFTGDRLDQPFLHQSIDRVVERSAFENQQFVFMAVVQQPLHLIRVHGRLAQQRQNGHLPEISVALHD